MGVLAFASTSPLASALRTAGTDMAFVADVTEQTTLPGSLTKKTVADLQGYLIFEKALPDPLAMNEDWDYRTQLALQKFLNKKGASVSEDGSAGFSTIRALQKFLNKNWEEAGGSSGKLWSDGKFGRKTVAALQNYLNAKENVWRPATEELQSRPAVPVSGTLDPITVKALQRYLNGQKIVVAKTPLAITGEWDFRTQMALQKFLNRHGKRVSEDGKFGWSSKKALQKFLNDNWSAAGISTSKLWSDGKFGGSTIKALQTYLNSKRLEWGEMELGEEMAAMDSD